MMNEKNNSKTTETAMKVKSAREEAWNLFKREFRFDPLLCTGDFKTINSKFYSKCNIPGCSHRIMKGDEIRHTYFKDGTGAVCMNHQSQEQAYYAFVQQEKNLAKKQEEMKLMQQDNASAVIYTDGAFKDGVYAWAYVMQAGNNTYESSGRGNDPEAATMRNIAGELSAVMRALSHAKKLGVKQVELHYDYTGIELWLTGAWKAKNPKTQKYIEFVKALDLELTFVKVKGHSGVALNERCDELCTHELNKAC